MLRRHSKGRLQRYAQDAVSWSLRSHLLPLLPVTRLVPVSDSSGPTIEDHVRQHVPGAARVGVLLGPPRANSKPVLRVFDASGRTLAFGKVAHDDLSSRLVAHEAQVLEELAACSFEHLVAPQVVHAGTWNGRAVLYQTPLTASPGRVPAWALPLAAMQELAESAGDGCRERVADSAYAVGLQARVQGLTTSTWLADGLDGVLARCGDLELGFGRWHGDWAPWNMGSSSGRQRVWDWERSATGVPLGLDVVHFLTQRAVAHGTAGIPPWQWLLREAQEPLARWCPSPREAKATVLLYVVELLHRYVQDIGRPPTAALRQRVSMLRAFLPADTARRRKDRHVGA